MIRFDNNVVDMINTSNHLFLEPPGQYPNSFAFLQNYTNLVPNLLFQASFLLSLKRTPSPDKVVPVLSRDPIFLIPHLRQNIYILSTPSYQLNPTQTLGLSPLSKQFYLPQTLCFGCPTLTWAVNLASPLGELYADAVKSQYPCR